MPVFPPEFIDQVRAANDIVEIIGQRIALEKRGKDYWGLCPFHEEKTASFSVSPSKQIYYCFGCKANGSVINFLMNHERLSFVEAVRALANRANILLPNEPELAPEHKERLKERQRLYKVSEWVADLYHQQLLRSAEAKGAREYLARRGFDSNLVQRMRLGYALPDWSGLLRAADRHNVPVPDLLKLGLIIPRKTDGYYDRFRGRVIIPIADDRNRVIAFGGRVLDDSLPKYLNSPESPLFSKGQVLFGLYQAKESIGKLGSVVLVEGYMDALSAWQHGQENVVASLGTALTSQQARLLKRYTNEAILCYDADTSGQQAAERGMEVMRQASLHVRVAVLPPGQDPDDYLRANGVTAFQQNVLARAQSLIDFKLTRLRGQYSLLDVAGKAQYVSAAAGIIAALDNEVERAGYSRQIAEQISVPEAAVVAEVKKRLGGARAARTDKVGKFRDTIGDNITHMIVANDPALQGYQVAAGRLLGLVLHGLVGAEELLLEWQSLNAFAHPADKRIVELLLRQLQAGQAVDQYHLLEEVADPHVSQRITEIMLAEHPSEESASRVARDCLIKLHQFSYRRTSENIQQQLVSETDPQKRLQLLQELQTLLENQKKLRH